jgi:hypothetical protein
MRLNISKKAKKIVGNAIVLSGTARSGTTIMGKIIHSFDGVEYAYEPPFLFSLFPYINVMPEHQWKLFYDTYLYEEFFINALSGRSINCNISDDSSIYNVKSESEIKARLSKSLSKRNAEIAGDNFILAYKMPDIIPFIKQLRNYYPKTRFVIMKRDALGTIKSLLSKGWFSNESTKSNSIWPFTIIRDIQIPFWVKKEDFDLWITMTELDRCAYYYIRMNEVGNLAPNVIEISYDSFVKNTEFIIDQLADTLNLKFGEKTLEILASVKPRKREKDYDLMHKIRQDFRALVQKYDERISGTLKTQ